MPDTWIFQSVPGFCACGRQERSCASCQFLPADDLTMNALRWFAERLMNCDTDQVPATTQGIIDEYRTSSRCESDDPDRFRPATIPKPAVGDPT